MFRKSLRFVLAASTLCAAGSASTIFNFDGDSLGTSTTFTDTVNGLSAIFSSAADPGGFVVYSSIFETLTGNVLGDPGPAGASSLALTVDFTQPLSALTLNFATDDFASPSPFTLTAYDNGTLVGSTTSSGSFLTGFMFPEGEIAFAGNPFNQVVLSSTATDFAIDNLNVITVAPEPAEFGLIGSGLLALSIPALRRRSKRS